jgi:hypothetical protein
MSEPSPQVQGASGARAILVRPTDRRGWFLLWGLLSALFMAIGSVGPWLEEGRAYGGGGIQYGDVWLVLVAAIVGAVVLIVWSQRRLAGVAALLAGLVGLAITPYDREHLIRLIPLPPGVSLFTGGFLQVGWGLNLALVASFSFALCGLVWLLTHAESPERSGPASATPTVD